MPPAAKELEEAILGAIMLERDALDTANSILTTESFYQENHQRIFRMMLELQEKSQPINILTVVQALADAGELEMIGGAYYITRLTNAVVSSANLDAHCLIVKQKFLARELIRVGANIYNSGFDTREDVFDMLDEAERSVMAIGEEIEQDISAIDDVLIQTLGQIETWRKMDTLITGVKSGFQQLDRLTRGWQPGTLNILAARPSVGKTAMALKLIREAAVSGVPTACFSMEMSKVELTLRLLASESETNLHRLQTGQFDDDQMRLLHVDGVNPLAKLKIYIDDTPSLSVHSLRTKARRLKKKRKIGFIVIDYLQLMSGQGQTREQEISYISRELKKLAKELQIPILALSQLSRDIEKRTGKKKMPILADLRESGAIEQDADTVSFLWAPDEEDTERDPGLVPRRFFRVAKARNGSLAMFGLDFKGETQVFKEVFDQPAAKAVAPPTGFKPLNIPLF